MTRLPRGVLSGCAAGAAGTTGLNAAIYTDMPLHGRPANDARTEVVRRPADEAGVAVPGGRKARSNWFSALGPLSGIVTGVGVGPWLEPCAASGSGCLR